MVWLPGAIVGAIFSAALAVAIGRMRHDSRRTIALNAIGYPMFFIGLGMAMELSAQAFWAAAAASLGTLLFTTADNDRRSKRAPAAESLA